jgi:superoxide dismutase, Cu-Zn family
MEFAMKATILASLIPCALLVACGRTELPPASIESNATPPPAETAPAATAEATLSGQPAAPAASNNAATPANAPNGTLQLAATSNGVQITGTVTGLTPNSEHGFHVHQAGDCSSADFKSAGDHFNPMSVPHGAPTADPHHLGDIPNLKADEQGSATVNAAIAGATLRDGGMHDLVGKAVIVHAKPDDYTTQPSGNSGDRIACGVVR